MVYFKLHHHEVIKKKNVNLEIAVKEGKDWEAKTEKAKTKQNGPLNFRSPRLWSSRVCHSVQAAHVP